MVDVLGITLEAIKNPGIIAGGVGVFIGTRILKLKTEATVKLLTCHVLGHAVYNMANAVPSNASTSPTDVNGQTIVNSPTDTLALPAGTTPLALPLGTSFNPVDEDQTPSGGGG